MTREIQRRRPPTKFGMFCRFLTQSRGVESPAFFFKICFRPKLRTRRARGILALCIHRPRHRHHDQPDQQQIVSRSVYGLMGCHATFRCFVHNTSKLGTTLVNPGLVRPLDLPLIQISTTDRTHARTGPDIQSTSSSTQSHAQLPPSVFPSLCE